MPITPSEADRSPAPRTLLDKLWDAHTVAREGDLTLLYVDLHLIHEVTSPQAFAGLRAAGRRVRRPERTLATVDHNVPTDPGRRLLPLSDPDAAGQVAALQANCREYGIELHDMASGDQGIVHVMAPELGRTLPGMTVVCGDSHTSTHGAMGALAFGIGTSEVELVLATQCLWQSKPRALEVWLEGSLAPGVASKDLALALIAAHGTALGTGHALEFRGPTLAGLELEARMTLCNMGIEAGARAAMVAPDERTFAWLAGRRHVPRDGAFARACAAWRALAGDPGARFDGRVELRADTVAPQVSWGTTPAMTAPVTGCVPAPEGQAAGRAAAERALEYMGLRPGTPIEQIAVDRVFIGSCTNGRLEDLRAAAQVARGYKVADSVRAQVVPGSQAVKRAAEAEGLDAVFTAAGFEWREPGCSLCLGMNADVLRPGERCASTSNRNFEGRQGRGGRTHLVSPAMAAAAAIRGRFTDVREWRYR